VFIVKNGEYKVLVLKLHLTMRGQAEASYSYCNGFLNKIYIEFFEMVLRLGQGQRKVPISNKYLKTNMIMNKQTVKSSLAH